MITSLDKFTVGYLDTSIRFSCPYRKLWFNIFGIAVGLFIFLPIFIFQFNFFFIPEGDTFFTFARILILVILIPIVSLLLVEFLWLITGIEVIEVDSDSIILEHQVFGIGISKKLLPKKIDGVFVSREDNNVLSYMLSTRDYKFFNFKRGKVAINYGKTFLGGIRTYRFGSNLDEAEAKQIVKMIHDRFPQYNYRKSQKTTYQ